MSNSNLDSLTVEQLKDALKVKLLEKRQQVQAELVEVDRQLNELCRGSIPDDVPGVVEG